MAFTGITATEAQIDQKTGANVDTNFTDTMKTQALLQAESFVNAATLHNWSDEYTTLDSDVKYIVTEATASLTAIEAILYNTLGYPTLEETENMINVLFTKAMKAIEILRDTKTQTFMIGV